jgi:S-adenosylmethionine:tRNA ribosyltransferase-isomerase
MWCTSYYWENPLSGILEGATETSASFEARSAPVPYSTTPRSTLFMLICAFAGRELMLDCYQEAIANNYRFYSYGDCMLIL